MRLALLLMAGALLGQQAPKAEEAKKGAAPVIPDKLQKEYWRELSVFHAINSNRLAALKAASDGELELEQERPKVNAAKAAIEGTCGESYLFDEAAFKKDGSAVCVAKKK